MTVLDKEDAKKTQRSIIQSITEPKRTQSFSSRAGMRHATEGPLIQLRLVVTLLFIERNVESLNLVYSHLRRGYEGHSRERDYQHFKNHEYFAIMVFINLLVKAGFLRQREKDGTITCRTLS